MTMKLMEGGERSFSCALKRFLFLTPGRLVTQLEELEHCVLNLAAASMSAQQCFEAEVGLAEFDASRL